MFLGGPVYTLAGQRPWEEKQETWSLRWRAVGDLGPATVGADSEVG